MSRPLENVLCLNDVSFIEPRGMYSHQLVIYNFEELVYILQWSYDLPKKYFLSGSVRHTGCS